MPSSTRPASPVPWSTPPIRTWRGRCSPASSRQQPDLADELRDDRLVRDALIAIVVRVAVAVGRARDTTRRWSSRSATGHGFATERDRRRLPARPIEAAAVGDPDELRHLEAPRVPAHRGARPPAGRRPSGRRPRARGAGRGVPPARAACSSRPRTPLAVDRDGEARRARAELRERRRRPVRPRRATRSTPTHAARRLLAVMAEPTPGRDRVPHRRRPPPRGPVRPARPAAWTSYAAWYERWAQTWEFQALIKARPVAGDADLGGRVHGSSSSRSCGRRSSAPTRSGPCAR